MSFFNLELKYLGVEEVVLCRQDSLSFIMDVSSNKLEHHYRHDVVSASASPNGGEVVIKYKDGHMKRLHESIDPSQIAIKNWLLSMPLVKDQLVDGARLSDMTYFKLQKDAYKKALFYAYKKLTTDKKTINMWIKKALAEFDKRILQQRGIDLNSNEKISETDIKILEQMTRVI